MKEAIRSENQLNISLRKGIKASDEIFLCFNICGKELMKNKKWSLPMFLVAMTMVFSNLKACYEGDFGALNKGH